MHRFLNSIAARLLLGGVLVLPVFLGIAGWALAKSHQQSLEAAVQERLLLQIYTLLSQAEYENGIVFREPLVESRLEQLNSGLYASIHNADETLVWQSPSTITLMPSTLAPVQSIVHGGQKHVERSDDLFKLSYQVLWETQPETSIPLTFTVMETTSAFDAQTGVFQQLLLWWLGGSATLLLLALYLIGKWGLRPLARAAADIRAIETGEKEQLDADYPSEIQTLTRNLDTLIRSERQRRERARNTLADLAHSLKTPLSVIQSADSEAPDYPKLVKEHANQMHQTIGWQLQRASAQSHNLLKRTSLEPTVQRLVATMGKVHADKQLVFEIHIDANCSVRGDERDLMELLGNLLDNACKYAKTTVAVAAGCNDEGTWIHVDDDGPGIPPDQREAILARGVRADSLHSGQGIGLAVANDICDSIGGTLCLEDSPLGGARISMQFRDT